jgi:hypothetical protein
MDGSGRGCKIVAAQQAWATLFEAIAAGDGQ